MAEDHTHSEGLARAIRVIRAGHDLSRKELAKRADLSYSYLAEIETGAKTPSSKALALLAKALGVAVHELMEAAERWEHTPPPHSFEELRDSTRATLRGDLAMRYPAAPITSLSRASTRREMLRQRQRARSRGTSDSGGEPSGAFEASLERTSGDVGGLEEAAGELLELLAKLGPEDRERLLDLARRLGDDE